MKHPLHLPQRGPPEASTFKLGSVSRSLPISTNLLEMFIFLVFKHEYPHFPKGELL